MDLRSRIEGVLAPVAVIVLALVHLRGLAEDHRRPPAPARCDPAVMVDGALRCDDAVPRSLAELCGDGRDTKVASGDAIDTMRACAGEPGGHARMDPETLARLGIAVDVNVADATELASLPGIGPVIAARMIAGRPYRSVDELERVKGIGPRTLARMRPRVRVD